eukprot:gene2222-2364_t
MSCFSTSKGGQSDRDTLIADKLNQFTHKFHNVRYPAVIDIHGDMISTMSNFHEFPPEYAAYVYTMKTLAEKVLKIFCTSNCLKLKVRSESQAFFSLYCLDQYHVLVFYCDIDPELSKAIDPTGNDDKYQEIISDMKKILSSSIDIV